MSFLNLITIAAELIERCGELEFKGISVRPVEACLNEYGQLPLDADAPELEVDAPRCAISPE